MPLGIKKELQKKGYKWLGSGAAQDAFLEPKSGYVLKIFSGSMGNKSINIKYIDFCLANQNNQFLPTFTGWSRFKWPTEPDQRMYQKEFLQIRMERLFPIADNLDSSLAELHTSMINTGFEHIAWQMMKGNEIDVVDEILKHMWADESTNYEARLMASFEMQDLIGLVKTILEVKQLGAANGVHNLDLHSGNFMHGSDGQVVISDPFHVW
tara:strand:+ start:3597 stop:4226 length:630 start_codon:yes stop_codon:yes gene_type:complete